METFSTKSEYWSHFVKKVQTTHGKKNEHWGPVWNQLLWKRRFLLETLGFDQILESSWILKFGAFFSPKAEIFGAGGIQPGNPNV